MSQKISEIIKDTVSERKLSNEKSLVTNKGIRKPSTPTVGANDKRPSIIKQSHLHSSEKSNSLSSKRLSSIGKKNVQIVQSHAIDFKRTFEIIVEGVNMTPKPLNPLYYERGKERQISTYDMSGMQVSKSSVEMDMFQQSTMHQSVLRQYSHKSTVQEETNEYGIIIDPTIARYPSYTSVEGREKEEKMPEHVSLILKETPTYFIFELPSKTAEKDTDEGMNVEEDNKNYEFLTIGKGRNRKVVNAEIQTRPVLYKSRETEKERVFKKHNYAFASGWDMFDTYADEDLNAQLNPDEDEEFLQATSDGEENKISLDSILIPVDEKQLLNLFKNPRFLEASIVIERLLANNNFNEKQKRFKGLCDPAPFRENIEYKYRLELLWTFSNDATAGRCVTGLCWNQENRDILAVGYGKFFFAERPNGMVMIWNIKNPVQPERSYTFIDPVTCVSFSVQNPNLLAVGFFYGHVKLIDISSRDVRLIGQTSRENFLTFEPIWQVTWISDDEYFKGIEQIIAIGQDGRVYKLRHSGVLTLVFNQMMRISSEGELKGIKTLRKCPAPGLPVTRYPGALVYTRHPIDPNIYFIGSSNGVVHKCSKNFFHQHLDSFLAHDGPIKQAAFSPFCSKLLLTCGDDWYARVWVDGVWEPIVELKTNLQTTEGADWSPSHSTIIATIGGKEICIWDLQRKTYSPESVTTSPTNSRNTVIQFTADGRCLIIGDIEGNVHVFSLEDMPFPAFFQANLLTQSIKRALIIRPDLIREIKKLGDLNYNPSESTEKQAK